MLYELLFSGNETMLNVKPYFFKYSGTNRIIEAKLIGYYFPYDIVGYCYNLLRAILFAECPFEFRASEFQKQPDDLLLGIEGDRFGF